MSARDKLRAIVDGLPEDQLETVLRVVESMQSQGERDPMLEMLENAPEDDEPLSEEERTALEEARTDKALGRMMPWEQVREESA